MDFSSTGITYDYTAKTATATDYVVDFSKYNKDAAGTYEIVVKYNKDTTIKFSYNVTVAVGTNAWTTNPSIAGWTYGATASTPVGAAKSGTVTFKYKVKGADDSTYTTTKPSDAGEYTMLATAPATNAYPEMTVTVDFVIDKAIATAPADAGSKAYTGSALVSDLQDTTEYTVTANAGGINAGSYTVTLTVRPNYKWAISDDSPTKTLSFTITRALVTVPENAGHKDYNGEVQVSTMNTDHSPYTITTNVGGTAVGQYDVVITLSDMVNYKWATGEDTATRTIKLFIDKATPSYRAPTNLTIDIGNTLSDITLPSGFSWVDGTIAPTTAGLQEYKVNYCPDTNNYVVVENISVYVLVADPAKESFASSDFDLQYSDASALQFEEEKAQLTYTGSAQTLKVVCTKGDPALEPVITYCSTANGTYTADLPAFTAAGEYDIWFKATIEDYNDYFGHYDVVVNKIAYSVYASASAYGYRAGTPLSILTIESPNAHETENHDNVVAGTVAWKDPTALLVAGQSTYVAVFTPTNLDKYEIKEFDINIGSEPGAAYPIIFIEIGDIDYCVNRDNDTVNIKLLEEETVTITFPTLSGYTVVYDEEEIGSTMDITQGENSYYHFEVYNTDEEKVQEFGIQITLNNFIKKLSVIEEGDPDDTEQVIEYDNYSSSDKIKNVNLVMDEGYTGEVYINGYKYVYNENTLPFDFGDNTLTVIVKDSTSKIIRYVNHKITWNYGIDENIKIFQDQDNWEWYYPGKVAFVRKSSISITRVLDGTNEYTIKKGTHYFDNYSSVSPAVGLNVYEAHFNNELAFPVYIYRIAYDGSETIAENQSYRLFYGDTSVTQLYNSDVGQILYSPEYSALKATNIPNALSVKDSNNNVVGSATITSIGNDLFEIRVPYTTDSGTKYYIYVFKFVEYDENDDGYQYVPVIDEVLDAKIMIENLESKKSNLVFTNDECVLECHNGEELIVETLNPGAKVTYAGEGYAIDEYGHVYITAPAGVQKTFTITIEATASGKPVIEKVYTVKVTTSPIKVFEMNAEGREDAVKIFVDAYNPYLPTFTGDFSVGMSAEGYDATMIDTIADYDFFNSTGEAWEEGDGAKYIKANISANLMGETLIMIDDGSDTPVAADTSKVVLMPILTTNAGTMYYHFYMISEDFGADCKVVLVEDLEDVATTTLNIGVYSKADDELVAETSYDLAIIDEETAFGGVYAAEDARLLDYAKFGSTYYYVDRGSKPNCFYAIDLDGKATGDALGYIELNETTGKYNVSAISGVDLPTGMTTTSELDPCMFPENLIAIYVLDSDVIAGAIAPDGDDGFLNNVKLNVESESIIEIAHFNMLSGEATTTPYTANGIVAIEGFMDMPSISLKITNGPQVYYVVMLLMVSDS